MDAPPPPPPPFSTPPSAPSPPPPVPVAAPPRNWWQRNWKWFVPTGCLTIIALGVAFVVLIILVIFGAIKSSDAYKIALERAKSDPRVIEELGEPIEAGWFLSGKTKVDGDSGESDLTIPIQGPKGKASVYAVATKSAGEWEYSKLIVKVRSTGETIDLLAAGDEPDE
jgi:hypothetical protein